jgi:hypothetical protein
MFRIVAPVTASTGDGYVAAPASGCLTIHNLNQTLGVVLDPSSYIIYDLIFDLLAGTAGKIDLAP